jgi:quercetin 2,3-dioxygenase
MRHLHSDTRESMQEPSSRRAHRSTICAGFSAPGASVDVPVPADRRLRYVFEGAARVGGREVKEGQHVILGDGNSVHFKASERAQALLLTGAPLREPVVEYGPFVMTSEREVTEDYRAGRFGQIEVQ